MFSESFHLQRAGTQELQHRPRKREISHALFRSGELRVSSDPATTAVADRVFRHQVAKTEVRGVLPIE